MKTTKPTYFTPECVYMDFVSEGILCVSGGENGSFIQDYDKVVVDDWD